jgi:hypothetical protein
MKNYFHVIEQAAGIYRYSATLTGMSAPKKNNLIKQYYNLSFQSPFSFSHFSEYSAISVHPRSEASE